MKKQRPNRKQIKSALRVIGQIHAHELEKDLADDTPHDFSAQFLQKEQQMYETLAAHRKRQHRRKVLIPAAVIVSLLLLSVTVWGIFSVMEQKDHADIDIQAVGDSQISVGDLPDGFQEVDSGESEKYSYTIYENPQGDMLRVMLQTGKASRGVDTEDRDTEEIEINSNPAYLTFDPENRDTILTIYLVSCSVTIEGDIDRDTAIMIGESIELR